MCVREGYGHEVSSRGRDVAELLAGGRTNREVAQALFLSCRTVQEHVSKILRKLKVVARREADL